MRSPAPIWSQVTAIFGGRFDPPHLGHIEAVQGLFKNPGVKRVRIIPCASPPHKPCLAKSADRFEMAQLNFSALSADSEDVVIDSREMIRAKLNAESPSYSYDTLLDLRREIPDLAFVIGSDQLMSLHLWHRFPEILGLCHWIILERKSYENKAEKVLQEWTVSSLLKAHSSGLWEIAPQGNARNAQFITYVPTPAPQLSSTEIRSTLTRTGLPPEKSVAPQVLHYIEDRSLYGHLSKNYKKDQEGKDL